MSGVLRSLADEVRKIARKEAREVSKPIRKFRVRRVSPLRLESLSSDVVLEEGDDDLSIGRGIRSAVKQNDIAFVAAEADGDYVLVGVSGKSSKANDNDDEEYPKAVGVEKRMKEPNLQLVTAPTDVDGCSWELPSDGAYRIEIFCNIVGGGSAATAVCQVMVDGDLLPGNAHLRAETTDRASVAQGYRLSNGKKGQVVKMIAWASNGTTYLACHTHTKLLVEKVGR